MSKAVWDAGYILDVLRERDYDVEIEQPMAGQEGREPYKFTAIDLTEPGVRKRGHRFTASHTDPREAAKMLASMVGVSVEF